MRQRKKLQFFGWPVGMESSWFCADSELLPMLVAVNIRASAHWCKFKKKERNTQKYLLWICITEIVHAANRVTRAVRKLAKACLQILSKSRAFASFALPLKKNQFCPLQFMGSCVWSPSVVKPGFPCKRSACINQEVMVVIYHIMYLCFIF